MGIPLKGELSWAQQGKHNLTKAFQFLLLFSLKSLMFLHLLKKKKHGPGQPRQSAERLALPDSPWRCAGRPGITRVTAEFAPFPWSQFTLPWVVRTSSSSLSTGALWLSLSDV